MCSQLISAAGWTATLVRRRCDPSDAGASLVEYALLLALIVVLAIGALVVIGNVTSNSINNTANSFP